MTEIDGQTEWVLTQLKAGRKITPQDAMNERGIMRLGARIWDLRQAGVDIKSRIKTVLNRFSKKCRVAEYYLEPPKSKVPPGFLFETRQLAQVH